MKIVHENIAEGVDPDDLIPKSAPSESAKKSVDTTSSEVPLISMTPAAEIFTEVKVKFEMGKLEAILYNGETNFQETRQVYSY